MPLVDVNELHKQFGENEVLRGVNLTVEEGDVVAVIGRSGSGKSTFLRILNGLETFDAGHVRIDGERISGLESDLRPLRRKVGMVFQQFNLFPHLTAGENVMLAPRVVKKESPVEVKALAEEMLGRVGLGDKFGAFPDQLSGGQQQRVAIARALAMYAFSLMSAVIFETALASGQVVATVGEVHATPNSRNVIAGEVDFTIDVRGWDEAATDDVCGRIETALEDMARASRPARRGVVPGDGAGLSCALPVAHGV